MMSSPYVPLIFAAIALIAVGLVGWGALTYVRAGEARRQEVLALYRRAIDLNEAGHKLQAESNSLMRELIAELRAGRQSPGTPPIPPADSN